MIHTGNAPCSWGTIEFEQRADQTIPFARMLDELVSAGYTGTELGDWGFMPTDPAALGAELAARKLTMTGAFVPVNFRDRAAHAEGEHIATRTARLLASVADADHPPFVVLADDNTGDPRRTLNAGRITPDLMLGADAWRIYADGVNRVARGVHADTGLRCVFHHHCAGFVETPDEIASIMSLTDPDVVGMVFDTGHYTFGTGKPDAAGVLQALDRFGHRIWYVHLKDCDPAVAAAHALRGEDYHKAVEHGIFCELGKGCVPFDQVIAWLRARQYDGFVTVEQDVLPGMGTPFESARRNRDYLRTLGL